MSSVEVKVPNIGDFAEVSVIELLVKPGDTIRAEQSLITVESDKASMEIPSSHAGVVRELKVKLGDKVAEGSVVAMVETGATTSASAPVASPGAQTPPAKAEGSKSPAGPAVSAVQLRRRRRPRLRHAGAGRGAGRLLGRLPRRRPRHEGGAGGTLRHARRRLPERRLHSVEGPAARRGRDGRGQPLRGAGRQLRQARGRPRQAECAQVQGGGQAHRRSRGDGQDAQGHRGARSGPVPRSAPCAGGGNRRRGTGEDGQAADGRLPPMHHRGRVAGRAAALHAEGLARGATPPARSNWPAVPSAC